MVVVIILKQRLLTIFTSKFMVIIEIYRCYASVNGNFTQRLNDSEEKMDFSMSKVAHVNIKDCDSIVVRTIKEKLNDNNGRAIIRLYQGDSCAIWFDENGKGLVSTKIPPANQLVWEVFDAAVEVVLNNGGKAVKDKARSGAKLGSDDLPLNSVEGYIAHKVHGVKEGETAFGPGFVICAVLDWADICKNERGYLTMNPTFSDKSIR